MSYHVIGRVVEGVRALYRNDLTDAEFKELTKNGVPNGFFFLHFNEGECSDNSKRVARLRELPVIVSLNKGDFYSERAEYESNVSCLGGSLPGFTTPTADVKLIYATALLQDRAHGVLTRIAPTDPPTNESKYVDALAQGLLQELSDVPRRLAHSFVHSWVRSQPEYVIIDNLLGGVHETKDIIEDPVKLATRLIVDLSAAPRHIIRSAAKNQPVAFTTLFERFEVVKREEKL